MEQETKEDKGRPAIKGKSDILVAYRNIDDEQWARLVAAWVDAAPTLAGFMRTNRWYRKLRKMLGRVIDRSIGEEVASVEETVSKSIYSMRIIPRPVRSRMRWLWRVIDSSLPARALDIDVIQAFGAAVEALFNNQRGTGIDTSTFTEKITR